MSECWGDVYMVGLGLGGQTRRTTSEEGGKSTEGWGPNRPQDRRRWAGGEAVGGHLDGSWTLGLWRWGNSNLVFRILLTMGMRLYKKSANVMSRFWNILLGHLSHYKWGRLEWKGGLEYEVIYHQSSINSANQSSTLPCTYLPGRLLNVHLIIHPSMYSAIRPPFHPLTNTH